MDSSSSNTLKYCGIVQVTKNVSEDIHLVNPGFSTFSSVSMYWYSSSLALYNDVLNHSHNHITVRPLLILCSKQSKNTHIQ